MYADLVLGTLDGGATIGQSTSIMLYVYVLFVKIRIIKVL
jgi:hypothetical protein